MILRAERVFGALEQRYDERVDGHRFNRDRGGQHLSSRKDQCLTEAAFAGAGW